MLDEIEQRYHTKVDYPVAEFVVLMGFFIILILEGIVSEWQERIKIRVEAQTPTETSPLLRNQDPEDILGHEGTPRERRTSYTSEGPGPREGSQDAEVVTVVQPRAAAETGDHHDHDHLPLDVFVHSAFRATLLLVALSFHSLFEGLAIGLQLTIGELWSVFLAVIVHKGIMAFALGLQLAQSSLAFRYILVSNAIFSISSPLGIAIGIGLTDIEESITRDIANGILQGIACGTFLYIALLEVLFPELSKPKDRMPKILFALLGCSSISALLFITH